MNIGRFNHFTGSDAARKSWVNMTAENRHERARHAAVSRWHKPPPLPPINRLATAVAVVRKAVAACEGLPGYTYQKSTLDDLARWIKHVRRLPESLSPEARTPT